MRNRPRSPSNTGDSDKAPTASKVEKALGMEFSSLTDDVRQKFSIKPGIGSGVVVTGVDPYSDAAEKHIQPGEVIMEINQEPVKDPSDVTKKTQALKNDGKKIGFASRRQRTGRSALRRPALLRSVRTIGEHK